MSLHRNGNTRLQIAWLECISRVCSEVFCREIYCSVLHHRGASSLSEPLNRQVCKRRLQEPDREFIQRNKYTFKITHEDNDLRSINQTPTTDGDHAVSPLFTHISNDGHEVLPRGMWSNPNPSC